LPIEPFYFDPEQLRELAISRRDLYDSASPFPHAIIDDFLPEPLIDQVLAEFPTAEAIRWNLYTAQGNTLKLATEHEELMGDSTRQLIAQLNSGTFVSFLEELTGITGLVADCFLLGGGLHLIERGGFLNIHADFNRHPRIDLERRINLLLYLNRDWKEEYASQLELWNADMTACEQRVVPIANRCVIFNTTDQAYHGHPQPLNCPPDRARRSIALYYYTKSRPLAEQSPRHSTLYQSRSGAKSRGRSQRDRLRSEAIRLLPAGGADAARKVRQRLRQGSGRRQTNPGSSNWQAVGSSFAAAMSSEPSRHRSAYLWSLLHAGSVARTLGYPTIAALEFGVAGGNGLVALEAAADRVRSAFGIEVAVYGFDSGRGLPPPSDHRDAPFLMATGDFPMDEVKLRARLRSTTLKIGLIAETLPEFLEETRAPVGFVSVDVDYYSSTVDVLRLFDAAPELLLPRVMCYFDDVVGYPWGDFNGERLAIAEFNDAHPQRKISPLYGLRHSLPKSQFNSRWADAMYLAHFFDHPRYNEDDGTARGRRLDLA
jgi:Rps23 Pro-64 3,4-dihydroxylase Tpa1-like proline 4-hydroxylase